MDSEVRHLVGCRRRWRAPWCTNASRIGGTSDLTFLYFYFLFKVIAHYLLMLLLKYPKVSLRVLNCKPYWLYCHVHNQVPSSYKYICQRTNVQSIDPYMIYYLHFFYCSIKTIDIEKKKMCLLKASLVSPLNIL